MQAKVLQRQSFTGDLAKLLSVIPETSIEKSLLATDNKDKRIRRLPKSSMVYFVIAMALCSNKSYEEVYRILGESQKEKYGPMHRIDTPATSSIVEARHRLGTKTMEHLSKDILGPIAVRGLTKGAFFKRWRVISIDGMVHNVPDTPENAKHFPRSRSQHGGGAYPQIRCVALVECGTRTVMNFVLTSKKAKSEQALALKLLPQVPSDCLLLADRLYCDGKKWRLAIQNGAKAIFRAKSDIKLPVLQKLKDGSYLSELVEGRRSKAEPTLHPVRVVEFRVKRRGKAEIVRLITNLDMGQATPTQVFDLYKERWQWETLGREMKQVLNNNAQVLRSNLPDLVEQEYIGMVLAHFTIKCFMHEAAIQGKLDMDRLSFTHSLNVVNRRMLHEVGAFPP